MISKVKIVNLFDLGVSSHPSDLLLIIVDVLCGNKRIHFLAEVCATVFCSHQIIPGC